MQRGLIRRENLSKIGRAVGEPRQKRIKLSFQAIKQPWPGTRRIKIKIKKKKL